MGKNKRDGLDSGLIRKAYNELVLAKADDNILPNLAEWICNLLANDKDKVVYFSLPIWTYLEDKWDPECPLCISNGKDKDKDWYITNVKDSRDTQFSKFRDLSNLESRSFSFVEFVTQNANNLNPVFTIEWEDDAKKPGARFEMVRNETLKLINNKSDYSTEPKYKEYREDFVNKAYSLLVPEISLLNKDEDKRKDLESLYRFLCIYQRVWSKKVKYIYLITSRLFCERSRDISSGGLILVCKEKIDDIKLSLLSVVVNLCYREKGGKDWEQKCRKEAIKSAVSAIMTRNMSHNLGSHYMYYTKADLNMLAQCVEEKGPDIRGAAKAFGYIQARMDYLATIVANDKYPYGAVNFKSQIYDELTIDDFSHRHFHTKKNVPRRTTNFLLSNLVRSEDFTRPDVMQDDKDLFDKVPDGLKNLRVHVKYSKNGKTFLLFTGSARKDIMANEVDVKNQLSAINIALPGGTMSCHALFNIIENFIRNSAKYLQDDIKQDEGLVCTIAIKPHEEDNDYIDLIIYDNKCNANACKINLQKDNMEETSSMSLYDSIYDKLGHLRIIDDSNQLSKESKGFKEMLFSAVWMRAYTFKDKTYADVISEINEEDAVEEKMRLIEKYGFSLVKVLDKGKELCIIKKGEECEKCSLGLQITVPLFKNSQCFELSGNKKADVNSMLNIMSDIVVVNEDYEKSEYNKVFTRAFTKKKLNYNDVVMYKRILTRRFRDFDKYSLCCDDVNEPSWDNCENKYRIYFERHLDTKKNNNAIVDTYAYADSISGGNFTITMYDLFRDAIGRGMKSSQDIMFSLKIKESALTRITIIDERLHNSSLNKFDWLERRNLRVLNYSNIDANIMAIVEKLERDIPCDEDIQLLLESVSIKDENKTSIIVKKCLSSIRFYLRHNHIGDNPNSKSDHEYKMAYIIAKYVIMLRGAISIFDGSDFKNHKDETHFLSIHLGLIEKILKNSIVANYLIDSVLPESQQLDWHQGDHLSDKRVTAFMKILEKIFGWKSKENVFIAINSGRGNFSAELEGPLARYPFITLSALEAVFNNSKFLLSQLFYNTVYIGKGYANS